MRKHFFVAHLLVVICCFLGANRATAQLYTVPPNVESRPQAGAQILFSLDWPDNPPPSPFIETKFIDPPRQISPLSHPSWQYFWVFDDGYYSRTETITREFSTTGAHDVYAALKGIYTTDDEPETMSRSFVVGTAGTAPTTVFNSTDRDVHLAQQYAGTRPDDWVTYVIAVRNTDPTNTRSGVLRLAFDNAQTFTTFSALRPSFNYSRVEVLLGDALNADKRVYEWDVSLAPSEEKRFAFKLLVYPFTPTELGNKGRTIRLDAGVQWAGEISDDSFQGTFYNKFKVGASNYYEFPDEVSAELSVKTSIDPNFITVVPTVVPPGYQGNFHYNVHFANKGSENADSIRVLVFQDHSLDPMSAIVTHEPKFDASFFTVTRTVDSITWATSFNLPHDTLPPGTNLGVISLDINPKAAPPAPAYVHGDIIRTYAIINMDGSLDTTNIGETLVREFKGVCLPAFWGARAYFEYGLGGDTLLHKGGFRAAITWRKSLSRFKNYTIGQSSVAIDKPSWWWQIELGGGYSRLKPSDGIKLNVYRVDLTPVMIRWVSSPKTTPVNPFFYGFSGAYTISGILGTSVSGGDYTVSNSFGDRLEHSLSASVDVWNILGTPGWSLGVGYSHRFTRITGQSDSYSLGFLYLHYNFKK